MRFIVEIIYGFGRDLLKALVAEKVLSNCVVLSFFFQSDTMNSVRDVLGRWGRKVGEASKKAEDLAGNTWQHCEFSLFLFLLDFFSCFVFIDVWT